MNVMDFVFKYLLLKKFKIKLFFVFFIFYNDIQKYLIHSNFIYNRN